VAWLKKQHRRQGLILAAFRNRNERREDDHPNRCQFICAVKVRPLPAQVDIGKYTE
jgi:hypothetical protein